MDLARRAKKQGEGNQFVLIYGNTLPPVIATCLLVHRRSGTPGHSLDGDFQEDEEGEKKERNNHSQICHAGWLETGNQNRSCYSRKPGLASRCMHAHVFCYKVALRMANDLPSFAANKKEWVNWALVGGTASTIAVWWMSGRGTDTGRI